ncbi:hypothetical protein [Streptomyces griseus]|uniref:hypothetical protein n=1 Tax=Streptomyces griseus TaxID=1911 RepID=UPI00055A7074|nr:hypothetical protein [Streptomyces griseus]
MSEIVVYELDQPAATGSPTATPGGAERPVRKVHAAPVAPGTPGTTGPRTLCGKDTFAMETARWKPSEHPEGPWYPKEHASVICPDCDAVMEI